MAIADTLKKFRQSSTPSDMQDAPDAESQDAGPRMIKLSDEEMKSMGQAQAGQEVTAQVSGHVNDQGDFTIMSVEGLGGSSAGTPTPQEVMGVPSNPAMPSPS